MTDLHLDMQAAITLANRTLPHADDWIEHNGGECPVEDVLIEAEMRDGSRYEGNAFEFKRGRWIHSGFLPAEAHITAYRLVKP